MPRGSKWTGARSRAPWCRGPRRGRPCASSAKSDTRAGMGLRTRVGAILVILAAACGSDDDDSDCPDGQVKRNVCVACGPAGGCGERAEQCAVACTDNTECPSGEL